MHTATSRQCKTKYCHNDTNNRGGVCTVCLNRKPKVPKGAEAERKARQPGARWHGDERMVG